MQKEKINDYLVSNADVESYGDGIIKMATELKLSIIDAKPEEVGQVKAIKLTREIPESRGATKNEKNKNNLQAVFNEELIERRRVKVTATGTVYGRSQPFEVTEAYHSKFGINTELLQVDGDLNAPAIVARLREIAPSHNLKEQRLNRLINSILTRSSYENYTSLLVVMLQKLTLMDLVEKTDAYTHVVKLDALALSRVQTADSSDRVAVLAELIATCETGAGVDVEDPDLDGYVNLIMATRPDEYGLLPALELRMQVWHCYHYEDGHSYSDGRLGDVFGFRHGRYKVPADLFLVGEAAQYLTSMSNVIPDTDEAIDLLGQVRYFVNVSGFSGREYLVLDWLLQGHKRATPFLVDQDVDLGVETHTVNAIYAPTGRPRGGFVCNKGDILSVMRKFVNNHRVFEDLACAFEIMKWWAAQPGMETLESQWWMHLIRRQKLPILGMRRAFFPMMVQGVGMAITTDALQRYSEVMLGIVNLVPKSLAYNAYWYWGEYLMYYNQKNIDQVLTSLQLRHTTHIDVFDRAAALASAVTGLAMETPPFHTLGLYVEGGIENYFDMEVPIGVIHIDSLHETGMQVIERSLVTNQIVPPGGVTLIVGMAGDLLRGTPYASLFTLGARMTYRHGRQRRDGLDFYDLWAYGVVSRWHGYDVNYMISSNRGVHTFFAANDVQIALPPVGVAGMVEADVYALGAINERDNVFASKLPTNLNYRAYFAWSRTPSRPLAEPKFTSREAAAVTVADFMIKGLSFIPSTVERFRASIMANYDVLESDFHVTDTMVGGVPAQSTANLLSLPHSGLPGAEQQ